MIDDAAPGTPVVIAVILNWNGWNDTLECLDSLDRATYPRLKAVVVDNGSTDGSVEEMRARRSGIWLVETGANLGFSAGTNVGIRAALEDPEASYVLLLNNDTVVDPGFLEPLVAPMEADPAVGMTSSKIYYEHEPNRIWSAGGRIDWFRGEVIHYQRGQLDRADKQESPEAVGFLTGAVMLIPRRVLESVGLLPEEYFLGGKEWDYSVELARAGFTLLYQPNSRVWHKVGRSHSDSAKSGDASRFDRTSASFTYANPMHMYNWYRNKLLFQRRRLPRPLYPAWLLLFVAYGLTLLVKQPSQMKYASKDLPFRALLRATVDHLRYHRIEGKHLQAATKALQ